MKRIFKIYCEVNCTTTLILPEDEEVSEIIEPTGEWRVNSNNKRYIYVVPDRKNIHTSLDIISKRGKIFSFILEEISGNIKKKKICKQVFINVSSRDISYIKKNGRKKNYDDLSRVTDKKISYRYRIRDKYFLITQVYDNGIFTVINLGKSQLRPALFIRNKKGKKRLEIVRYVDNGKEYMVHRVLDNSEYFVLKFGGKESIIGRY